MYMYVLHWECPMSTTERDGKGIMRKERIANPRLQLVYRESMDGIMMDHKKMTH